MNVNTSSNKNNISSKSGFTLLEVITVLIILGIIAAVAVSRYRDTGADDVAVANTLKAHLRYAQLRAMGDIVDWGIEIEADKYTLVRDNGSVPNLPGENSAENNDLDAILSPLGTIMFSSARGRPYLEGSNPDNFPNSYEISVGITQTITITPETGFIE